MSRKGAGRTWPPGIVRTRPRRSTTNSGDSTPGGCAMWTGSLNLPILSSVTNFGPSGGALSRALIPMIAVTAASSAASVVSICRRVKVLIRRAGCLLLLALAAANELVDGAVQRRRVQRAVRALAERRQRRHGDAERSHP